MCSRRRSFFKFIVCAPMTKRRAEGVLYHDSPQKRLCFQSLCTNDMALPDLRLVPDADGSLLSFLSNHCRKRNHVEPGDTLDFYRPPKRTVKNNMGGDALTDNVYNSGRFPKIGMQQIASKKRPREDTEHHEADQQNATAKVDEDDMSTFNTFQFWRVPLLDLDMSVLENNTSPQPMTPKNSKNSESMET